MVLSRDTAPEIEQRQIAAWRSMSTVEKTALVAQAAADAEALALAGIRRRYPEATERECFLRLAELRLGHALVRAVYPDAADVLDRTP